ncbi:pentapeptide repeat-containing protein [bacterium]|nr:pentapeptide repeat-containing protein [bacterium]
MEYSKEELFDLIINSPEKFNEWKKTQTEEVDLSELDFSSQTLENVDLENADLNGSSFADCHLTEINFKNTDSTSVDFTRAVLVECDFSDSLLTGADFSYASANYCNFSEADVAGLVFQETNLENSDLSSSINLNACRFDEDTVWPDQDLLPEDFDGKYSDDLSSLKDNDDENQVEDY